MKHRLSRNLEIGERSSCERSLAVLPIARWWIFIAALAFLPLCNLAVVSDAKAGFAGRFSLSVGEEYSDNIFFEQKKEHDFATVIKPTFSILYAPFGQTTPIFSADFTPEAQIFARHSEDSNFGKNLTFNTEYTHHYSPRLIFYLRDTLRRLGETRSGSSGFTRESILPPSGGGTGGPPTLQRFGDFVSNENEIWNEISTRGIYTYSPNISFTGGYAFGYRSYLDTGGNDIWHRVGGRGVYRYRDEHNLHFGYSADIIKSRDGDNNIVHNIDIGDDYFSSLKLNLDPTLTVFASTGIGIVTGDGGVRLANRVNLSVTKLWQTATLIVGANKGITPSLGVAGVSDTTSFFANFNIRFTELLSAYVNSDFSFYDTEDGNFKTFTAGTGLRYRISSWLSSELRYTHRWEDDAGSAATCNNCVQSGRISSNSIALTFTANFDVWPTRGFARGPAVP
jgi:hypothetical protein